MIVFAGVFILLVSSIQGEVNILLHGRNINELKKGEPVKAIETDNLHLYCISNYTNASFIWTRYDDVIITVSHILKLTRVRLEDTGNYSCSVASEDNTLKERLVEQKTVYIEILYPPSIPVVIVPKSVLMNEELSLTCLADALPEPTYHWRLNDYNGHLLSRNKTYNITATPHRKYICCNVQTLMIPSFEEPRSIFLSHRVYIDVHKKAYISHTSGSNQIRYEGDSINFDCYVGGYPTVSVWWTKFGNDSFFWRGGKYIAHNIDTSFTGDYICHVENTVVPANQTAITVHETSVIFLKVYEAVTKTPSTCPEKQCSAEDCTSHCATSIPVEIDTKEPEHSSTQATSKSTVSTTTEVYNCSSEEISMRFDEYTKDNQSLIIALIASTGLGWMSFIVLVVYNAFFCVKTKKEKETRLDRGIVNSGSSIAENQTVPSRMSIESAYLSDVRFADNTYTDLTTYDQISARGSSTDGSYDSASVSTETSVVTYIQPTHTAIHF